MIFFQKLRKVKDFKTFFRIIGWSAGGSFIALACVPMMTRMYEPSSIGLLGVIVSVATAVAPIVSGRYEQSLLLARSLGMASALLWLVGLVAAVMSVILFLIAAIYSTIDPKLGNYVFFVPAFALAFALFSLAQKCFLRFDVDDWVGKQSFLKSASMSALPLLAGVIISRDPVTLVSASLAAMLVAISAAFYVLYRKGSFQGRRMLFPGWAPVLEVARAFSNMPKFNVPHAVLNATVVMSPYLVITHQFGLEAAGLYAIANRFIAAPVSLINQASGAINSKAIAANRSSSGSRPLLRKVILRSGIFSGLAFLVIWLLQDYMVFLLGEGWNGVDTYLLLLCPYLFSALAAGSLAYIPVAYARQKNALLIEVVSLALRLGGLMLGARFGDIYLALGLFSLASLIVAAGTLIWYEKVMRDSHA